MPIVIVIENPDADPSVHVIGDVELVSLSSYPATAYAAGEAGEYADGYAAEMCAHADRVEPMGQAGAAAADELRGLAAEFERRHLLEPR